jgi:GNAT superfamily N-acetyltransferase
MFHVRTLSEQDFPFAVQLTDQMDWGMVEEDFKFMKRLEPEGCFVLFAEQERAGIATTVNFGKKGWFGNLIVTEKQRNRGAGSLLVEHSVKYLRSRGVKTIGLYAYIDKVDFYERLGFEYDSEFIVLRGKGFSSTVNASVSEAGRKDMQQIIECDAVCFGAPREKIFKAILKDRENVGYKCMRNGTVVGYALAKVYDGMADLGPLVCPRGHSDLAISLLEAVLNRLKEVDLSLCLPRSEKRVLSMLLKNRFVEQFRVARMFLGQESVNDCVYVAESLERG